MERGNFVPSLSQELFSGELEQAKKRRHLIDLLEQPGEALWDGLSDFLREDENHSRLLLYLPFEVLPGANETGPAAQKFREMYWQSWIRLLHQSEPRANFVDGDILEPGLEEPERISKAGHLTGELLARNIITPSDVIALLQAMEDKILLQSLAEGAIVAHDRGLLESEDWNKAKTLIDSKLGLITRPNKSDKFYNNPDSEGISEGRKRWLKRQEKEKLDNETASRLAIEILEGLEHGVPEPRVAVLTFIKMGKILAAGNLEKARRLINQDELLRVLWDSDIPEVKDAIVGGLNQWMGLGIVSQEYLDSFGVKFIDLTDVKNDESEFDDLAQSAQKIKEHPILSEYLYPGFLVFGSRVKGYADIGADLDAAMFFKPETAFEKRDEILEILKTEFPELKNENLMEFWTTREKGRLRFKIPVENTRIFIGEDQVHFLLGGLWVENDRDLDEIRADILHYYLEEKEQYRELLLGLLEVDAVLCRVLHKGYRKLNPIYAREKTVNSDLIDGDSDFWDPGYRRVATKLFLSKVFLPSR